MKKLFLCLWALSISFSDLSAQGKTHHHKITSTKKNIVKYGTASFYATKFNGRKTANGNIYNSVKYTAACNVLPLNTWIKVTNLSNDKSVIVMVNDRLHARTKRLIDLSKDAARKLGYVRKGITRVKVEVLRNFQLSTR